MNQERRRCARIENSKQYVLKTENVKQNKFVETGVNVCDGTVRNHFNEMGFFK